MITLDQYARRLLDAGMVKEESVAWIVGAKNT